jgi:hypothetical protein
MCFPPPKRFAPPLTTGATGNEPGLLFARNPLPTADAGGLPDMPPPPPPPPQQLDEPIDRRRFFDLDDDEDGGFGRGDDRLRRFL